MLLLPLARPLPVPVAPGWRHQDQHCHQAADRAEARVQGQRAAEHAGLRGGQHSGGDVPHVAGAAVALHAAADATQHVHGGHCCTVSVLYLRASTTTCRLPDA